MLIDNIITDDVVTLKNLDREKLSKEYITWLNDTAVNKYLETRHQCWDSESAKAYVGSTLDSPDQYLLGIYIDGNKHIGNIKLGPILKMHQLASIALIIGDKSEWQKGYAVRAIKLLTTFAFNHLKLEKLTAGMYEENIGSLKAFLKTGFSLEAIFKKHYALNNNMRTNVINVGLLREDFNNYY
jgi:[ribosomal protein S5]-alanine N-acetyltransferase